MIILHIWDTFINQENVMLKLFLFPDNLILNHDYFMSLQNMQWIILNVFLKIEYILFCKL